MLVIITSILEDIMDTEKVEKKLFHRMLKTQVAVAAEAAVVAVAIKIDNLLIKIIESLRNRAPWHMLWTLFRT